jgi:tetratricopeptide (TPR) repeat protein
MERGGRMPKKKEYKPTSAKAENHFNLKLSIALFLFLATAVTFEQVRNHEFLNFDDSLYVTDNPYVQAGLTPAGLLWAFTTTHASNWHPLSWLSHMLDCELYGLNPGAHHLTSLLFHIAATLLLFLVFKRMTGKIGESGFVAVLFALHPLHVESVAWVAERKDVLSTFFWVLTMWTYLRYVEGPGFPRYVVFLVSFVLGLLSKPMLVTLPFVLLLLDYWPLGRIPFDFLDRKTFPFNVVLEKVPLFILSAASASLTFFVQQKGGAVGPVDAFPIGNRVANVLVSYVGYVEKMIWPRNLAVLYPYPDTLPDWQAGGAALLLACVSILVIRAARRRPYLAVGWLWYLGTLVPVIGLVKVGLQAMADRYTYVPLIGLFILVAMGVPDILPKWRYQKLLLGISAALLISVLIVVTRSQVRHWRNDITLYEHALNVTSENSLVHTNLGAALARQGKYDEAVSHYTEALRIKPDNANARNNLGLALIHQSRYREAIVLFAETLRNSPHDPTVQYGLGIALARQGRYQEAIVHFSEALRMNPLDANAHYNLGLALACQGKDQEAVSHYTDAVRINPNLGNAHYYLGLALTRLGKDNEAVSHYAEALRINPREASVHHDMGIALARQGKYQEAISHFVEALRIEPRHAKAHYNLGVVMAQQGKNQEAIAHYAEALQIDPNDADAQNNMGVSLAHQGKYREAVSRFAEAVRIRPDFAEARFSLALAHLRVGNQNQALEQYRILKKTRPDLANTLSAKILR